MDDLLGKVKELKNILCQLSSVRGLERLDGGGPSPEWAAGRCNL